VRSLPSLKVLTTNFERRVIEELRRRFAHYLQTGDDSLIPADIESIIYSVVCFNLLGSGGGFPIIINSHLPYRLSSMADAPSSI
jgi:hypothetical protein